MLIPALVPQVPTGDAGCANVESPGTVFRAKEADYPFFVSFDDGPWVPWDVGMDVTANKGSKNRFQRFRIKHYGPTAGDFVFLIGDDVTITDNRLTVSEGRSGSPASFIPPNLIPTVSKVGVAGVLVDTWYELLPFDAGRAEAWLCTDAAAAAYWNIAATGTGDAAFNLVKAAGEDRWTRLPSKAAIWVRHTEAAKSITALSFGF